MANEISLALPVEVAEGVLALAKEQNCTVGELIREALGRYVEHGQLVAAIMSGQDRSDALEDFLMENVNRIIHESRAEKRVLAETTAAKAK